MFKPIKITTIELSQPIQALTGLENYGSIEGLVCLWGRPIGKVQIPVVGDTCAANTLVRAVLEQMDSSSLSQLLLERLPDGAVDVVQLANLLPRPEDLPTAACPQVTVAVCTRDRPHDLKLCLDAIQQLDYPNLDLLVIDNAPTDRATAELVGQYENVRYVVEHRPGLSWARNRAIAEAQGEIIAFTDDDVMVDPGWVTALVRVFNQYPEVMVVTGYVAAYELETEAQFIFEQAYKFGRGFKFKYAQINKTDPQQTISQYGATANFGTGANMSFRRSLFEQIGSFDPALGAGTLTTGGEDLELFFRALHEGFAIAYEPGALVRHRHRRDYAGLQKQIRSNGIGVVAYLTRSALAYPGHSWEFLYLGWKLLIQWNVQRLLLSFIRPSPRRPRDLILLEMQGAFQGWGRYQKACAIATQLQQTTNSTQEILPPSNQIAKAKA